MMATEVEHRCADCIALRDEIVAGIVKLLDLGVSLDSLAVERQMPRAALWADVSELHDAGAQL